MDKTHELIDKLEEIRVLISSLIEKTDHTNQFLKQGLKTQFGKTVLPTVHMDGFTKETLEG